MSNLLSGVEEGSFSPSAKYPSFSSALPPSMYLRALYRRPSEPPVEVGPPGDSAAMAMYQQELHS